MSDMLQKLLGVEKAAAKIVADAEVEADRLTAQARVEAQSLHADLVKKKAAENDAAIAEERERLAAEREARNLAERDRLSRLSKDVPTFRAEVLSLMHKAHE